MTTYHEHNSTGSDKEHWLKHPLDLDESAVQIERATELISGAAAVPALRWYWALRPTLILGVFQPAELINSAAADVAGVPIVRRRSGGTAVLAGPPLLSVDIAVPFGHKLAPPDVTESYHWLGQLWLDTLVTLGLQGARLVTIDEARQNPYRPVRHNAPEQELSDDQLAGLACYASLSPYEVAIGKQKIVGLAQVRRRGVALYQVGLPLSWDSTLLASLLTLRPADLSRMARLLEERCTGLDRVMRLVPERELIVSTFERLLSERYDVALVAEEVFGSGRSVHILVTLTNNKAPRKPSC